MDFLHERVTPAFHVPSATHPTPIFNSAPLHVVQDPYFRTAPREIAHMVRVNLKIDLNKVNIPCFFLPAFYL